MKRVKGHGRGQWVCTPKDFLDLGTRAAIDQALSRLVRRGQLRRVDRGLYDLPRISPVLKGPAPADLDASVNAIARRDGIRIMPSGSVVANRLGLTNAVPARAMYLTDGATRTIRIGKRTIHLKHAKPKLMRWTNKAAGPVVNALMWLGPTIVNDPKITNQLRRQLPDSVKQDLLRGASDLPSWAIPLVHQLQN